VIFIEIDARKSIGMAGTNQFDVLCLKNLHLYPHDKYTKIN